MKLVSYVASGRYRPGVLVGDRVVDVGELIERATLPRGIDGRSVRKIIETARPEDLRELEGAAQAMVSELGTPRSDLTLGPPVPDPSKILGVGLNYASHVAEASPAERAGAGGAPLLFAMFPTSLIGDGAAIELPAVGADAVDWEGELAVVIGKVCHAVSEVEAPALVAGYMVFNDVSARDLQMMSPQWTIGKSFDTSGPCGPALVTADEVSDPQALTLTTTLNGRVVQSANTSEMLRSVPALIAAISSTITLLPGDIIATGTPAGVGAALRPMVFLKEGDVISVSVSGVGTLTNTVRQKRMNLGPESAPGLALEQSLTPTVMENR